MPDDETRGQDPAISRYPSPSPRSHPPISGWVTDPAEPSGWRWVADLGGMATATQMLPVVPAPMGRIDFQGAVDWAWPPDQGDYDTGDLIDPNAPDPTPDEITDPDHPDHVDPWTPA